LPALRCSIATDRGFINADERRTVRGADDVRLAAGSATGARRVAASGSGPVRSAAALIGRGRT